MEDNTFQTEHNFKKKQILFVDDESNVLNGAKDKRNIYRQLKGVIIYV
jgi:hypothetical protein